jgi:hypothetical protein
MEQDPWEKFAQRKAKKHDAEDKQRLCVPTLTTAEVIENFLTPRLKKVQLDEQVPRRMQMLRDFLTEAIPRSPGTVGPYWDDVERHRHHSSIALIDDRKNHQICFTTIGQPCTDCCVVTKVVDIPDLCSRLQEKVCL